MPVFNWSSRRCHLSCSKCSVRLAEIDIYWVQMVEKKLGASENSFAVSSLEMGKRYIVTIIAYKENKRSKVVETIFRTGLCTTLLFPDMVFSFFIVVLCHFVWHLLGYVILRCNIASHHEYSTIIMLSHLFPSWPDVPLPHGLRSDHEEWQ